MEARGVRVVRGDWGILEPPITMHITRRHAGIGIALGAAPSALHHFAQSLGSVYEAIEGALQIVGVIRVHIFRRIPPDLPQTGDIAKHQGAPGAGGFQYG